MAAEPVRVNPTQFRGLARAMDYSRQLEVDGGGQNIRLIALPLFVRPCLCLVCAARHAWRARVRWRDCGGFTYLRLWRCSVFCVY